jgi:hypothetical protein
MQLAAPGFGTIAHVISLRASFALTSVPCMKNAFLLTALLGTSAIALGSLSTDANARPITETDLVMMKRVSAVAASVHGAYAQYNVQGCMSQHDSVCPARAVLFGRCGCSLRGCNCVHIFV